MRLLSAILVFALAAAAQDGRIRGQVTMKAGGEAIHNATVVVPQLGRSTETDGAGRFEFARVPPGVYDVVAHMHHLSDERKRIDVAAGGMAEVVFALELAAIRQEVTVTASGKEETTLEAFQTVTTVEGFDLTTRAAASSLGELLDNQTGVAKRSFGPGTSRPVVRGFDGDRVLVLEDGVRTGTLSSQSGDHGEPVAPSSIERVEVVRGPATLLYGSNAIGGVVNTVSSHHMIHEHPHPGLRGRVTGFAGTNNDLGGGSAHFEYGSKAWLLWGGGGGQNTNDYRTPEGKIDNSGSYIKHADVGFGRYGEKAGFAFSYGVNDGRYGVPFAAEAAGEEGGPIELAYRRQSARFTGSVNNPARGIDSFRLRLNYTDWNHRELKGEEIGTEFFNKQFIYRGDFQQRQTGRWSGSFGFWGMRRDYEAQGAEALSPPVDQNAFALYALEQVDVNRVRFQFGGRMEYNGYRPEGLRDRSFTGFSGGAGVHVPAWRGGAVVANFVHSYRAPALEELYNRGPHAGNVAFEVGRDDLDHETGDGVDLSLRHQSSKVRADFNFFYYRLGRFMYFERTGEIEDGLPEAVVAQNDARFLGAEARLQAALQRNVWLHLSFDMVDAQLTASKAPLPRIPPVRGRVAVDVRAGALSVRPELTLSNRQSALAGEETATAGYATAGLTANYTLTSKHVMHVFGVNAFNLGDRLYRNHLSYIKDFAPEIGRGVRFSYTMHLF